MIAVKSMKHNFRDYSYRRNEGRGTQRVFPENSKDLAVQTRIQSRAIRLFPILLRFRSQTNFKGVGSCFFATN